jgi:leader peptidase (prepilin peptidase)/N-methyltransferase
MLYILAGLYGLIIGNYLTSAYFRIPRNIPINGFNKIGKKPHCSVCGHKLKFYEYFPLLNWFSTRFKCNYCHAPIDPSYMIIEILLTIISLGLYLFLGMTPIYSIAVLFCGTLVLNLAFLFKHKKFFTKSVIWAVFLGLVILLMARY